MWNKIVGHEGQIEQLKRAIQEERLAHAYLFAGPPGIGKALVAATLVQALGCSKGWEKVCGECTHCSKVTRGIHPDLHPLSPPGQFITIDQVRTLQDRLAFHPLEATYKFAVIDEAERMNAAAANALLKTLEEPTPRTCLILISAQPHQLLPTVLSRCHTIRFNPLTKTQMEKFLKGRSDISPAAMEHLVAICEGSPGQAITFPAELIEDIPKRFEDLLSAPHLDKILELSETWAGEENLSQIIQVLQHCWRSALLVKEGRGKNNGGLIGRLEKLWSREELEENFLLLNRFQNQLTTTYNKQLLLEELLTNLWKHHQ